MNIRSATNNPIFWIWAVGSTICIIILAISWIRYKRMNDKNDNI